MNLSRDAVIGFIVLALIGIGFIWFALVHPPAATPQTPKGEMGGAATPGHITDHGQYYDIDTQYPASTALAGLPDSADANAVALMKQWELDTIASFKTDSGLDSLTPEDIQVQGLGDNRKYALTIAYETHSSPRTVSYVYQIFADTLGAHPNTTYKTFTFDTQTGINLSLAMLFTPGTDYLGYLSKAARAELPAMIAARENADVSQVDTSMINDGTQPTEANFQNFYLDGNDLIILFPPYQIGPYALGSTEFHIPRSGIPGLKADYQ